MYFIINGYIFKLHYINILIFKYTSKYPLYTRHMIYICTFITISISAYIISYM